MSRSGSRGTTGDTSSSGCSSPSSSYSCRRRHVVVVVVCFAATVLRGGSVCLLCSSARSIDAYRTDLLDCNSRLALPTSNRAELPRGRITKLRLAGCVGLTKSYESTNVHVISPRSAKSKKHYRRFTHGYSRYSLADSITRISVNKFRSQQTYPITTKEAASPHYLEVHILAVKEVRPREIVGIEEKLHARTVLAHVQHIQ